VEGFSMRTLVVATALVFLAAGTASTQTLVVTSPAPPEEWRTGDVYAITWTASGSLCPKVEVSLVRSAGGRAVAQQPGAPRIIVGQTPTSLGRYVWRVPWDTAEGTYRVRVGCPGTSIRGSSQAFMIKPGVRVTASTPKKGLMAPITVQRPEAGILYTVGPGPADRANVMIQWATDLAGPFQVALCDATGKSCQDFGSVGYKQIPGHNIYYTERTYYRESGVSSGVYRMRVRTADELTSALGGKFQFRNIATQDVTINLGFDNRYQRRHEEYSWGQLFDEGLAPTYKNKPDQALVGFENSWKTKGLGEYSYVGFAYRSRLLVDLGGFAGKTVTILKAEIQINRQEHDNGYQDGINLCGDKIYVSPVPWGDANFLSSGPLVQILNQGYVDVTLDITPQVKGWINTPSSNWGLLFTGVDERFRHLNDQYCVSYYTGHVKITFNGDR
jgi:hypothetical protein